MAEVQRIVGYMSVFVAGFAACATILQFSGRTLPASSTRGVNTVRTVSASGGVSRSASGLPSVAEAAAKVEPAVVNIEVKGVRRVRRGPFAFLQPNTTQEFEGSGSGIILSPDGYIVTNNHVIEGVSDRDSGTIKVQLDSGRDFLNVSIVGRDPATDLAVLKIHGATNLPIAELGDSEGLRVGDWAIAVGNPLGFNSSVTLGIISALNRSYSRSDTSALDRVIQTDAAINPGNSGGALADIDGRVIGINTAIASQTGGSVGIGFAIPINTARRIIDQLIKQGKVTRPYLGVVYSPVSAIEKQALPAGVTVPEDGQGAVIVGEQGANPVVPGSPADKAGLRPFDVIRAIDGKPLTNVREVKETVLKHDVGDRLTVRIWRNGQESDVIVPLEAMPENFLRRNRHRFTPEELLNPEGGAEMAP